MSKKYVPKALKVERYDWPSYLASALINNDFTGCSKEEEEAAKKVMKHVREKYGNTANIVNADCNGIFGRSDSPLQDYLKGNLATYTVLHERE